MYLDLEPVTKPIDGCLAGCCDDSCFQEIPPLVRRGSKPRKGLTASAYEGSKSVPEPSTRCVGSPANVATGGLPIEPI
jgi:hypothetical protein